MDTSITPLAQALWPAQEVKSRQLARNTTLCLAFSGMIALCAHIAVPIPGTPVPMTMQTLGVLLTGTLLGARLGGATLVLYLLEGLCGLPVFAPAKGATSGLAIFGLPTFGYLIGFIAAAYIAGRLAERGWDRTPLKMLGLILTSNAAIYLFGVAWLMHFPGVGSLSRAFALGVAPFLIDDALKAALAATILPAGWKLLEQWKQS